MDRSGSALVLEFGATWVRLARCGPEPSLRNVVRFKIRDLKGDLAPVLETVRMWSMVAPQFVVVAVPGVVDYDDGRVVRSFVLPRAWWSSLSADGMSDLVGSPAWLTNDVDLAAIAVANLQPGATARTMLYVNLGTGLGAAVVDRGRLVRGRHSLELADLHLGSAKGMPRSRDNLMEFLSAKGIDAECPAQRAGESKSSVPTNDHSHCREGVCHLGLLHLGIGLNTLCDMFSADSIVVGGPRALLPGFEEAVVETLPERVVRALQIFRGRDPALLGAWYLGEALCPASASTL